jgi:hypothetical protein
MNYLIFFQWLRKNIIAPLGNPRLPGISLNGRQDPGRLDLKLATNQGSLALQRTANSQEDPGRLTLQEDPGMFALQVAAKNSPDDLYSRLALPVVQSQGMIEVTLPSPALEIRGHDAESRLSTPTLSALLSTSTTPLSAG